MREFNADTFVADARALVGTEVRWLHQGRDPATGLDCVGLPRWLLIRQMGALPAELETELTRPYHRHPDGQRLLETVRTWFDEVGRADMRAGDLVVVYDRRNPQHIAIACDSVFVVEAYANRRIMKIVYWPLAKLREIAGVFRFPTVGPKAEKWQS